MAGVTKAMSRLSEGSTGILFLNRGAQDGHFLNVVKKGEEVQYWCAQSGRRVTDPINEFSLGTVQGRSFDVISVDLMVTSKGGGPVKLKGSLP
jgi:hypothetical protein